MKKKETPEAFLQYPDYRQELIDLLRSDISPKILKNKMTTYHEKDLAAALEGLTSEERKKCYWYFEPQNLAGIFTYLYNPGKLLREFPTKKKSEILSYMEVELAVRLLQKLPKEEQETILELMNENARKDILLLQSFQPDEIGSCMSTRFVKFPLGISAKKAMYELREQTMDQEHVSIIYVVDHENRYVGAIDIRSLMAARDNVPLGKLVLSTYPFVYGQELTGKCLEHIKEYAMDSIPVLAEDGQILGVITAQRVTREIDEKLGESYARLAAMKAEEGIQKSVAEKLKNRLPSLLLLFLSGFLVSVVTGLYEKVYFELTFAVCFQSMIMGMAGNAGTQSLAATIQALLDELLTGREKRRLFWREILTGIWNSITFGVFSFMAVGSYLYFVKEETFLVAFSISACIAGAMLLSILFAVILGTLFPVILKKAGFDPSVLSASIMDTVCDLIAVVSYYSLTWILLIQYLQLAK